ncbi:MAG: 6-phosphogluconolactonase [Nitrospirae bacterium]|nr:6-phosphogluconolactonase [Nitrospirota bacterium]NTW66592.1 6-phosphogluconolactonase [Nitrospirota bacterium]
MTRQHEVEIKICDDEEELAAVAADLFVERSEQALGRRGRFLVALSGGTTPRRLYALLASPAYSDRVDWRKTEVFWVDERCVPPDHPESNYRMANDLLLSKVPLEAKQIHRIRGEEDPETAATYYGMEVSNYMPKSLYTFDLAVLGMGIDGHTASLFPGDPAVSETERVAVVVEPKGQQHRRISVTMPVLNHVVTALFLVAGPEKAATVREILDEGNPKGYPAGLVLPAHGELVWYLDGKAASLLSTED